MTDTTSSKWDAIFDDLEAAPFTSVIEEDPFSTPYERRRTPLEKANTGLWVERLSPFFEIEQQVSGVHCTGQKFRMDFLLHPRETWSGGNHHPIGFEIKRDTGGIGEVTRAIGQASDYAHSTWTSKFLCKEVKCFVAINMSYAEVGAEARILDRIAGRLNVAIFRDTRYKDLTLSTSGEVRWSSKWGSEGSPWLPVPKVGCR